MKCLVTLSGDHISQAVSVRFAKNVVFMSRVFSFYFVQDICFDVQRTQNVTQRTTINPESPWKLQQIQDAANHLQEAIHHIDDVDSAYHFK